MMYRKLAFFLLSLVYVPAIILSFELHPYHVSYTEIYYSEEKNELTVSMEVFTDDLEMGIKLAQKPEVKLFLGSDSLSDFTETLIQNYVQENFKIFADSKVITNLTFLPSQSNPDRTIIYFEILEIPRFSSLTVNTSVLLGLYPSDQQNIVEFNYNGKKIKSLLNKDKTTETYTME